MSQRVKKIEVTAKLPTYDTDIDIQPFIDVATLITDKVEDADSDSELTSADLLQIEACLAAHFYTCMADKQYTSKSTLGASGSFQGQYSRKLDSTDYGQTALLLDITGYLEGLQEGGRPKASVQWLGRPPSEQTDFEDRD